MSPKTLNVRKYDEVRHAIPDGSVLLFRSRGYGSSLIQLAGRGKYSHAAIAVWARGVLLCCENREFKGGRAVALSSQVEAYPERIDVYRLARPSAFSQDQIDKLCECMLRKAGARYGWSTILRVLGMRLPVVWRFMPDPTDDEEERLGIGEDCSQAVSDCLRRYVADPVKNLADGATEPSDLSRSTMLDYYVTLSP